LGLGGNIGRVGGGGDSTGPGRGRRNRQHGAASVHSARGTTTGPTHDGGRRRTALQQRRAPPKLPCSTSPLPPPSVQARRRRRGRRPPHQTYGVTCPTPWRPSRSARRCPHGRPVGGPDPPGNAAADAQQQRRAHDQTAAHAPHPDAANDAGAGRGATTTGGKAAAGCATPRRDRDGDQRGRARGGEGPGTVAVDSPPRRPVDDDVCVPGRQARPRPRAAPRRRRRGGPSDSKPPPRRVLSTPPPAPPRGAPPEKMQTRHRPIARRCVPLRFGRSRVAAVRRARGARARRGRVCLPLPPAL